MLEQGNELSARQRETLSWIKRFVAEHGIPPTVREIGKALSIESSTAFYLLEMLQKKGYLRRGKLGARSLVLRPNEEMPRSPAKSGVLFFRAGSKGPDSLPVPILGTVTAGRPILAVENRSGELWVKKEIASRGVCFGLRVRGDSMSAARIREGDVVVARQQPVAENGDIVVAMLGEDATVKQLSIRGDHIELKPRNATYASIPITPGDDFRILGKVIAVATSDVLPE